MANDVSPFVDAHMERCAYLSVIVFLGYEYLLQFSNEVELFWKKRWSVGKVLFLWSRYYSLGFNTANAIVFMNEHSSPEVNTLAIPYAQILTIPASVVCLYHTVIGLDVILNASVHPFLLIRSCEKFFHWQNTGAALQVITTHIILEMRIYAMYGSNRFMLALCCFLTVSEAVVYGIVFGIAQPGEVATNNPAPGLFICADADPPDMHWITWFWLTIIIIESILMCLSVYKGWTSFRQSGTRNWMFVLTRDSVFYFVVIFLVYVMNMIFWFVNVVLLDEFATGFSFCVSTVLANRLLISMRERYYHTREVDFLAGTLNSSLRFKSSITQPVPYDSIPMTSLTYGSSDPTSTTMTTHSRWEEMTNIVEELELNTFSERRGF